MAEQSSGEELDTTPAIFHATQAGELSSQGPPSVTDQPFPETEEEDGEDEVEQLTLAEILRAVHKCTMSVQTLLEHFGGLKEEVRLIHDLQKIRECTTAVEGCVSDVEDKLAR